MWTNNFKLITRQAIYTFKVWINKICWGKIFYQDGSSSQMSWVRGSTLLCESPGPDSPSLSVLGFRTLLIWMLLVCKYIMTKALFWPALLSWYSSVLLHRLKTSYFKKGSQCGWSHTHRFHLQSTLETLHPHTRALLTIWLWALEEQWMAGLSLNP